MNHLVQFLSISFSVYSVTSWSLLDSERSPFLIVIDGGSTGSRLHIFEFVEDEIIQHDKSSYAEFNKSEDILGLFDWNNNQVYDEKNNNNSLQCVCRGSTKIYTPLSDFARSSIEVKNNIIVDPMVVAAAHLPLFDFAADILPPEYHSNTEVRFMATAGMRLVDEDEQLVVYEALYKGLMMSMLDSSGKAFPFTSFKRSDIDTLPGELEGFYGVLAANYLAGAIDSQLKLKRNFNDESVHSVDLPAGSLDMGGSSIELSFLPSDKGIDPSNPLNVEDFYSQSYLSYGVDTFRERLWRTWINDKEAMKEDNDFIIQNPCYFEGYTKNWNGYTLQGTGDASKCAKEMGRLIVSPEEAVPRNKMINENSETGKIVGGIKHPKVRGKFFALSLFYFTLDSLRVLSEPDDDAHKALNASWPNPSIKELSDALQGLCGRSWKEDLGNIKGRAHKYTVAEVLPDRCFESVYMVSLLRDGFGFHSSSRDIIFTFDIDGSEAEWTLGMALSIYAEEQEDTNRDDIGLNEALNNQQQILNYAPVS